jgi:hypothetical protein
MIEAALVHLIHHVIDNVYKHVSIFSTTIVQCDIIFKHVCNCHVYMYTAVDLYWVTVACLTPTE